MNKIRDIRIGIWQLDVTNGEVLENVVVGTLYQLKEIGFDCKMLAEMFEGKKVDSPFKQESYIKYFVGSYR